MGKEKDKLTKQINIRVSPYEMNFIKGLAGLYAEGNVSVFLVYAAFNAERKMITEDDLVESKRIVRRGQAPSELF